MDLWVRSQDGDKITKVNSVNILAFENDINIHGYIDDKNHFWLGKYKSKERALEVLDEIQKTIINNEVIRIIMPNVKDMRGNEELYKENVFNTMVYEMPKE